jgi:enolase
MPIVVVPARPVAADEHLNGRKHADNSVDLHEFMVMPVGAPTFVDELDMCAAASPRSFRAVSASP